MAMWWCAVAGGGVKIVWKKDDGVVDGGGEKQAGKALTIMEYELNF